MLIIPRFRITVLMNGNYATFRLDFVLHRVVLCTASETVRIDPNLVGRCCTTQYNTIQHNTIQYNTIQK
jgi:hypothetical protein